jgi:hypothetical protein
MLGKAFARLKKQKKNDRPEASSANRKGGGRSVGQLTKILSASGRVSLASLRKMAREDDANAFVYFVRRPVLVGSAVKAGIISSQTGMVSGELNRTQVFEPSKSMSSSISASESLKHAVYPLVKGEYPATPRGSFYIGRINGNDMIMPDYAISKRHAIIDIDDGSYYLRDAGSTNGTKINGTRLGKKRVKLKDKDVIGFARYEFTFLYPKSLYKMLSEFKGQAPD